MSALAHSLSATLARWELYARPDLPTAGFVLDRPEARTRRGIYRSDGTRIAEPEGYLHRISPSPDGTLIAAEWAADADELAVLSIIEVESGAMHVHPSIRLRYDSVLWDEDSNRLAVVASRDNQILAFDVTSGAIEATLIDEGTRVRLFSGGRSGLLATRSAAGPTLLIDRESGAVLGRYDALYRAMAFVGAVIIWHDGGLDVVNSVGDVLWRWADSHARIVDFAVRGGQVVVLVVRAGRSVLLALVDGVVVRTHDIDSNDSAVDVLSATAIGVDGDVLRIVVEGPLTPPQVIECDATTLQFAPPKPALDDVVTVRHDIRTDDGADVVVHVSSPRSATGPLPLILACYGGFGVPFLPTFEPTIPTWVAHGGAYATAQLRGGGEHGTRWREAGRGANKQRSIDDLTSVARALVNRAITTPELLVLVGASLGGTIAASCAYQHPSLCAGVVATAAPLDLLRLDTHPLGGRWKDEFGDDGTPQGRHRAHRISPLARVESMKPATIAPEFLGIVLEKDTRVNAADTQRMVDALHRVGVGAQTWMAPAAGHGANDMAALHQLGLKVLDFAARLTMETGT